MNACDNVVRLARELRICRTLLYKWRHQLEAINGQGQGQSQSQSQSQSEVRIRNSRESTFRREVDRLKRLVADKTLEVDFFKTALQRIEVVQVRLWTGNESRDPAHHALTASTIDNGLAVAMTRASRKPAPCSSLANSAFVRSRPRGVSTSISKSSSLP